jgi:hypothetical protein
VARKIQVLPLEFGEVESFLGRFARDDPPGALTRHL